MSKEKFEEWLQPYWSRSTFTDDDGEEQYRDEWVQGAWMGWQAASKASDQQLAAVVAENTGLKKFCKNAAFDADYEAELCMEQGGFTDALDEIKTPATDAAIANIQAQGVDAAIERLIQKFEGTGHIGVPVMVLESFAAQLRQGAAL